MLKSLIMVQRFGTPLSTVFLCCVCIVDGAISTPGSHLHQHNGPIHPVHSSLSPHPSSGQPCRKKLKRLLHRGLPLTVPSPACDAFWLISFHLTAPKSSSCFHSFILRASSVESPDAGYHKYWFCEKSIWKTTFYTWLFLWFVQHLFRFDLMLSYIHPMNLIGYN